jgi:hypothetical protein
VARQDRRSPDAADLTPTVRPVPGLPTWPLNPQPLTPVSAQAIKDDRTPWLTVGLIAGAVLALAGTAAMAGRIRRRIHRAGLPACTHATGAGRCPAPVAAGSPYAATRYSCKIRASLPRTNRAADSQPRRLALRWHARADARIGTIRLRVLHRIAAEHDRRS